MVDSNAKAPGFVIEQIRAAILDGLYQPGERVLETELAVKFKVSRSPVREALQALEGEGTLFAAPYTGAMVTPLSAAELYDIAEIRLALIALALKPAYAHLAPVDFDLAHEFAKRITRTKSAREAFECNRRFWDIIFLKAQRPVVLQTFRRLNCLMTRYYPLLLQMHPDRQGGVRPHEAFIEVYRKGEIVEALRVFRKVYLESIDSVAGYLEGRG